MTARGRIHNRLLATLPPADLDLLMPDLGMVALRQDEAVSRAGEPIEQVYFPHNSAISLMVNMANGKSVATAVIGCEGAVNLLSVLGPSPSAITAVVHAPGMAARIRATRFHAAFTRSAAIRQMVQTYVRALMVQLQHTAACNALHPVEARLARWLLHFHDRVEDDVLPLTQEALAEILGVRRTTVTLLMRNLRACGAIKSERRGQIEIDRSRLAAATCECHDIVRQETEEIFSHNALNYRILPERVEAAGETGGGGT
jgi:CRP-like cAMP-binding protein